jgi:Protein of unknown function (DUF2782)
MVDGSWLKEKWPFLGLIYLLGKNYTKIAYPILSELTMRRLIVLSLFALPLLAAEKPQKLEALPDVPAPPGTVESGEEMEPDITIVRKGKKTIQEFRRGGRLYMVKVIPDIGPPYYFLDTNGDGKLDVRRSELDRDSNINMWKLLEWE